MSELLGLFYQNDLIDRIVEIYLECILDSINIDDNKIYCLINILRGMKYRLMLFPGIIKQTIRSDPMYFGKFIYVDSSTHIG